MSYEPDTVSRMVTVEVIVPAGVDISASDLASHVEDELGSGLCFENASFDEVTAEIGTVAEIDPGVIVAGNHARAGSVIPPGREVLLWQDTCPPLDRPRWAARVHRVDIWNTARYDTAEDAIRARDTMRDAEVVRASRLVVERWEKGDLAEAVRELARLVSP